MVRRFPTAATENGRRAAKSSDNGRATKKDQVLEQIRDRIVEGDYRPGTRLYIEDVAAQLNVSPTPVREALRQLETEGLVESRPHRGVTVTDWTYERIRETFLIRRALETLAANLAAVRLTDRDLELLERAHAEAIQAFEQHDYRRLRLANRAFHATIHASASVPQLSAFLQTLWAHVPVDLVAYVPDLVGHTVDSHARLLTALRERDAKRASDLMREHLTAALDCLERWAEESGLTRSHQRAVARRGFRPFAEAAGSDGAHGSARSTEGRL